MSKGIKGSGKPKVDIVLEFQKIYHVINDTRMSPEKINPRFVVKKDYEDGIKVRCYPERKNVSTGFDSGYWNQTVCEEKIMIAVHMTSKCQSEIDDLEKELKFAKERFEVWNKYMESGAQ
jgi:hypothetical protein